MKKSGKIKGFRIFHFRKNVEKEDVLSLREALEMVKGLQKMDSHGIEMIVVKLDHVLNFCELRNEGSQEPCLEHLVKTLGGPPVIDDSKEGAHGPWRGSELIIDQIQELPDEPLDSRETGTPTLQLWSTMSMIR